MEKMKILRPYLQNLIPTKSLNYFFVKIISISYFWNSFLESSGTRKIIDPGWPDFHLIFTFHPTVNQDLTAIQTISSENASWGEFCYSNNAIKSETESRLNSSEAKINQLKLSQERRNVGLVTGLSWPYTPPHQTLIWIQKYPLNVCTDYTDTSLHSEGRSNKLLIEYLMLHSGLWLIWLCVASSVVCQSSLELVTSEALLVIKRSLWGIFKISIKFLLRCNSSNLSLDDHLIAESVQCRTR